MPSMKACEHSPTTAHNSITIDLALLSFNVTDLKCLLKALVETFREMLSISEDISQDRFHHDQVSVILLHVHVADEENVQVIEGTDCYSLLPYSSACTLASASLHFNYTTMQVVA